MTFAQTEFQSFSAGRKQKEKPSHVYTEGTEAQSPGVHERTLSDFCSSLPDRILYQRRVYKLPYLLGGIFLFPYIPPHFKRIYPHFVLYKIKRPEIDFQPFIKRITYIIPQKIGICNTLKDFYQPQNEFDINTL